MATPSLLQRLKDSIGAISDSAKSQYAAGPQTAPLTPGVGSVLDQRNTQMLPLLPPTSPVQAPQSAAITPQDLITDQARYGERPGEKRIDVTEYLRPLGGLSGVKRK